MKFLKFSLITVLLLGLVACSEPYKIDKTAAELSESVISAVPLPSGYYKPSDAYFEYYFSEQDENVDINSLVSDWCIMKSSSQSSENEIGVLIAKDGCLEQVKEACLEYLDERREAYLESKAAYSPEEYEKYRDAEQLVRGNCVFYLILDSDDCTIAKKAIDTVLEK